MERLGSLFPQFQQPTPSKYEYEYQELCTQLEPIYGKGVWRLPFQPGVTEYKIRQAHKIASERKMWKLPYLIGIIKKLPWNDQQFLKQSAHI